MTIDDHSLVWSSVAVLQGSSIGVVGVPEWEIGHPSDADPIMPFKTVDGGLNPRKSGA